MAIAETTNQALETYAEAFKALSDPVRLDLFLRIAAAEEIACTDIVRESAVTASTVSYHVKILKAAGFVAVRKEGRNYHYSARRAAIAELGETLVAIAQRTPAAPVV